MLAARPRTRTLAPDPDLPADTRLWAALQSVSGGLWGGCVYDPEAILAALGGPPREAAAAPVVRRREHSPGDHRGEGEREEALGAKDVV